jgi:hypothetical protein
MEMDEGTEFEPTDALRNQMFELLVRDRNKTQEAFDELRRKGMLRDDQAEQAIAYMKQIIQDMDSVFLGIRKSRNLSDLTLESVRRGAEGRLKYKLPMRILEQPLLENIAIERRRVLLEQVKRAMPKNQTPGSADVERLADQLMNKIQGANRGDIPVIRELIQVELASQGAVAKNIFESKTQQIQQTLLDLVSRITNPDELNKDKLYNKLLRRVPEAARSKRETYAWIDHVISMRDQQIRDETVQQIVQEFDSGTINTLEEFDELEDRFADKISRYSLQQFMYEKRHDILSRGDEIRRNFEVQLSHARTYDELNALEDEISNTRIDATELHEMIEEKRNELTNREKNDQIEAVARDIEAAQDVDMLDNLLETNEEDFREADIYDEIKKLVKKRKVELTQVAGVAERKRKARHGQRIAAFKIKLKGWLRHAAASSELAAHTLIDAIEPNVQEEDPELYETFQTILNESSELRERRKSLKSQEAIAAKKRSEMAENQKQHAKLFRSDIVPLKAWPPLDSPELEPFVENMLRNHRMGRAEHVNYCEEMRKVTGPIQLAAYQELIPYIIGPFSPLKRLLFVASPGSGKTCVIHKIAEQFHNKARISGQPPVKILVLVPGEPQQIEIEKQSMACPGPIYTYMTENNLDAEDENDKRKIKAFLAKQLEVLTYAKAGNQFARDPNYFKGKVILMDEVHNLVDSPEMTDQGDLVPTWKNGGAWANSIKTLYRQLKDQSRNNVFDKSTIVGFTATPIVKDVTDLFLLLNVIHGKVLVRPETFKEIFLIQAGRYKGQLTKEETYRTHLQIRLRHTMAIYDNKNDSDRLPALLLHTVEKVNYAPSQLRAIERQPEKALAYVNVVPQLLDAAHLRLFKSNEVYFQDNAPKLKKILQNVTQIISQHGGKQIVFSDTPDKGGAEGFLELMLQRNFKLYPRTCEKVTLYGGAEDEEEEEERPRARAQQQPPPRRQQQSTWQQQQSPPRRQQQPQRRQQQSTWQQQQSPPRRQQQSTWQQQQSPPRRQQQPQRRQQTPPRRRTPQSRGRTPPSRPKQREKVTRQYNTPASAEKKVKTGCRVVNTCQGLRNCKQVMYLGNMENVAPLEKEELIRLLAAFNSPENATGELIPVIILTSKYAEGVDFKGVRAIHFMEQQAKIGRFEQIVGRARRFCSHRELHYPDQWTVDIYQYMCVYPKGNKRSIEEQMYVQRLKDKRLKDDIMNLAGSVALDCLSNSLRTGFKCKHFTADELRRLSRPPDGPTHEGEDEPSDQEEEDLGYLEEEGNEDASPMELSSVDLANVERQYADAYANIPPPDLSTAWDEDDL